MCLCNSPKYCQAIISRRIVPIPKGCDKKNPLSYRPVSILPILSKLLEKQIANLVLEHLWANEPLSQHQWGFTPGKSTTTALISFTPDVMNAVDMGFKWYTTIYLIVFNLWFLMVLNHARYLYCLVFSSSSVTNGSKFAVYADDIVLLQQVWTSSFCSRTFYMSAPG